MVYFFVFHFVWGHVGLWKDVGATTVNNLPISLHTNTHMYMGFPAKRDFKQRGAPHGMLYISSNTTTLKKADENSLFHKEDVHWKLPQGNDWHDDVQISNSKSRWTFWGQILPSFLEAVWCRCGITGQGATIYFHGTEFHQRDPSQDPCLCLQKKDDFHKNYLWNTKSSGHVMWISRRVLCFSLVETIPLKSSPPPLLSFYDGKEINSKIKDV